MDLINPCKLDTMEEKVSSLCQQTTDCFPIALNQPLRTALTRTCLDISSDIIFTDINSKTIKCKSLCQMKRPL